MTNEQMRREFDEHCKQEDPAYQPTDDSIANRRDWAIWQAATKTERERCTAIAKNFKSPIIEKFIRSGT